MKIAAFDLEIAKQIPDGVPDLKQFAPLGITCAAVSFSDKDEFVVWQGIPQLTRSECQTMVTNLSEIVHSGYTLITWNGCAFDFFVLAQESGLIEECADLALDHVDLMLMVTFTKGHFLSLEKALQGAGVQGKLKTVALKDGSIISDMVAAKAPRLWAAGEYDAVLQYLQFDVAQLLELTQVVQTRGAIRWISNTGNLQYVAVHDLVPVRECFKIPEPDTSWMRQPPRREQFVDWIPGWNQRIT